VRLVKVQVPQGQGDAITQIAFAVGIGQVTVRQEQIQRPDQERKTRDVVDVEVATPTAKTFIDAVMAAQFYNPDDYAITVRQPRSIVSRELPAKLTHPLAEPTTDLLEELWQFSHITAGFVGRVLLAALLLAYGMIVNQLLVIVAALLFLPSLPILLAIGFGLQAREWGLLRNGVLALITSVALTIISGVTGPPMRFTTFSSTLVSALMALTTGVAAGLALPDDAGRRELIGLAAASQIAVPAVWLGISLAFGAPAGDGAPLVQRGFSLLLNIAVIIAAGLLTTKLFGMQGVTIRRFAARPRRQDG
jgi:hypothetical protein